MRIAYIVADGGIPVFGTKGASVHVRELVRALGRDNAIDLYCASMGDGCYDLPVQRLEVVPLPPVACAGNVGLERDLRRVAGAALVHERVLDAHRSHPYEMIYERYSLLSDVGASLAEICEVPYLLEVNAPLIQERGRVELLPLAWLAQIVERHAFGRADAVLAVSEAIAAYVAGTGVPGDRVQVIPNGVDASRFHPHVPSDRIRRDLGVDGALVVGFAGSLKPWHGVDVLLDAFARVARDDWRLLVVGDGPERARLEAQAGALGLAERAIFTGAVSHDDVPGYVATMDVAVAPYRAQPDFYFSPLKLFEYMAAGRPVVASDIGQIRDVVRPGDNGYLVPPDDAARLAAALAELAVEPGRRETLGARAAHDPVTWDDVARRVTSIARALRREGVAV